MNILKIFTSITVLFAFMASIVTIIAFFEDRPYYAVLITGVFSRTTFLAYWNILFLLLTVFVFFLTYYGTWFLQKSFMTRFVFAFKVATAPIGLLMVLLIMKDITYVNEIKFRFVLVIIIFNALLSLFIDQFLLNEYERNQRDSELILKLVDTLVNDPESSEELLEQVRKKVTEGRESNQVAQSKD